MKTAHISAGQFFCILLAGRLSNCLLLPSDSVHALSVPDLIGVTLGNAVLLFFLILPTAWTLRHGDKTLTECVTACSPLWGKVVGFAYVLASLFILYLDMLQFERFAGGTVHAEFSVPLLIVLVSLAGFLAAFYGIQALGRTAAILTVVGVVTLVLLGALVFPRMKLLHFPPAVWSGFPTMMRQILKELPRTAEIVAVGALYPCVKGKILKSYTGFITATAALTLFVCLVTTGVLGDYAGMTEYPFYTAVIAGTMHFSPDLLVVVLWLGTFFARVALFGAVYLDHIHRLFGNRAGLPAIGIGTAVLVAAVLVSQMAPVGLWKIVTVVYGGVLAVFCIGIPLVFAKGGERTCG